MFSECGESYGADAETPRCLTEAKCGEFKLARSETGDGMNACNGCELLPTKPGTQSLAPADEEVSQIVEEIADIVFWENADSKTEWTLYPFETRQLYGIWREAERTVKGIQEMRMQMFIKSFGSAE